jgi:hypothetical protein
MLPLRPMPTFSYNIWSLKIRLKTVIFVICRVGNEQLLNRIPALIRLDA